MNIANISILGNRIAFYLIVFFAGIVVLLATGGVALAFMLGGVICPIGGLVKLAGSLLGYNVPIRLFDIDSLHMPPALGLLLSVILGIALFFTGKAVWKVTRKYIVWIVETKRNMLGNEEAQK